MVCAVCSAPSLSTPTPPEPLPPSDSANQLPLPRDKYTIGRVQVEDVANWIGIMQFVVNNVRAVLIGCVLHAHEYTDESE